MKLSSKDWVSFGGLSLTVSLLVGSPFPTSAQWANMTPDAQRNALSSVRSQVSWLQNSTRTAASFGDQGYGNVWQSFQGLRQAYTDLKQSLTQQQLAAGANAFAELDAGLDIIQEAFANYQEDVGAGQPPGMALRNMCSVLRQASAVWLQELNKRCSQLRVGWG